MYVLTNVIKMPCYSGGDLSCSCKHLALALILMALLTSLYRHLDDMAVISITLLTNSHKMAEARATVHKYTRWPQKVSHYH